MPNVYEFKDFEGSSHRILIDLIRRFAARGGTLLDLGASAGHLGAAVRDHFEQTIGFEYEVACVKALHDRSEEHTSELQSQSNLVCRLLLEKKKTNEYIKQI